MLEQETDLIISTIQQRTIGRAPSLAMKDILAADIPPVLKVFFRADLELTLAEELYRIRKESRFNYSHPEIQSLQNQINSLLLMHYVYQRPEFLPRLADAVHLMVNYLVRPQWTLAGVMFEKDPTISSAGLLRMFRYFSAYDYLRDIFLGYIQEKQIEVITESEFTALLRKADGEFVRRKTGDEMAKILSPMYDFFDYPQNSGTKVLPLTALSLFFEDKGLTAVVQRLGLEGASGTTGLGQHELGELLESVRRLSGAFEVGARLVDAPPPTPPPPDAEPIKEETIVAAQEPTVAPVPAEEGASTSPVTGDNASETMAAIAPEPAEPEQEEIPFPEVPPPHESTDSEKPQVNIAAPQTGVEEEQPPAPFVIRFTTPPESHIPPPALAPSSTEAPTTGETQPAQHHYPPVASLMDEGDRRKIIKRIFKYDEVGFRRALEIIDTLPSWKQASIYIDEIYIANNIDPYSSEAERFTSIVRQRYFSARPESI